MLHMYHSAALFFLGGGEIKMKRKGEQKMKTTEIKKEIVDTIDEIRADKEDKWIREHYVIDLAFCSDPGYKLELFHQWAKTTGYWDRLRRQAEEDLEVSSYTGDDMMMYLEAVNNVNGLTDEFENRYDEEMGTVNN